MKYFKDEGGKVFAYSDIQTPAGGLSVMSSSEIKDHIDSQYAVDNRSMIASERYKRETSGILINGIQIDTGRDSQALITGATVQAMLDSDYSLRWKTIGGFVEFTAEQIIGVASAVRAHVQECFDREAELLEALDSGAYTEEMLSAGWPNQ